MHPVLQIFEPSKRASPAEPEVVGPSRSQQACCALRPDPQTGHPSENHECHADVVNEQRLERLSPDHVIPSLQYEVDARREERKPSQPCFRSVSHWHSRILHKSRRSQHPTWQSPNGCLLRLKPHRYICPLIFPAMCRHHSSVVHKAELLVQMDRRCALSVGE